MLRKGGVVLARMTVGSMLVTSSQNLVARIRLLLDPNPP